MYGTGGGVSCSSDSSGGDETTTYTVTYSTAHGTVPSSITVDDGTSLTSSQLPTLSADGYTFGGWFVGSTTTSADGYKVTSNVTLTASWTAISYTITFEANEGTFAETYSKPESYTIEDEVSLPSAAEITKSGSAFKGWFENSEDVVSTGRATSKAITKITKGTTGNKTFYAKWVDALYSVKYEGTEGAALADGVTLSNGFTSEDSEITLPTESQITKTGYTFGGWFKEDVVSTGRATAEAITSLTKDSTTEKTLTLYAKWTAVEYKITFEANGGTFAENFTAASSYTIEDEITLPTSENISKTGYGFDGWFESKDLSGEAVSSIAKGTTGDKVFYAKWMAISYTITYKNADGAENPNPASYTIEDEVTLKDASKKGYTFEGWFEEDVVSTGRATAITKIAKGTTENKTFYAKWTAGTKTIYFLSNYSSSSANATKPTLSEIQIVDSTLSSSSGSYKQTIIFGETTPLLPVNYYADKWLFTGWNTKADGSGTSYANNAKVLWNAAADSSAGSDVTQITESNPYDGSTLNLYAQWKAKTANIYSITLPEADDGDINLSTSGTNLTAKFSGFEGTYYWYVDGSSTETYKSATRVNEKSTTDLTTYSTFDCAKYIGTPTTKFGIHTVMVRIWTTNNDEYTQTAVVSIYPAGADAENE